MGESGLQSTVSTYIPLSFTASLCCPNQDQGCIGGPVLLALKTPYKPISADTVGSITKEYLEKMGFLQKFGAPLHKWGGCRSHEKIRFKC